MRRILLVALLASAVVASTLAISIAPASADAPFYGSLGATPLNQPVVAIAPTPAGDGYWIVASDGGVFSFGHAPFLGSLGELTLVSPIVDMAAQRGGRGYWLAAADGGVFSFGTAPFLGSLGGLTLVSPIVGIAARPRGGGYWLAAADGGVFSFGRAPFLGSAAGATPPGSVVGIAPTAAGDGYWLATRDGRVLAFGSARHFGDASGLVLAAPIVEITASPDGAGYSLLGADGGVFTFGSARFHGSTGGSLLNAPVIDIGVVRDNSGYWELAGDGGVFAFPGTAPPPPPRTPTIVTDTVVSGLDIPWDLGFLPDGTMLFTERPGRISARVGGGTRVIATPSVYATGEGGLTGLAIDPAFAQNRHIYTCGNVSASEIRVTKWHVNTALTAATKVGDLVSAIPANASGRHSGCRPRFGPDGRLWIGTGDAAQGTNPQNLAALGGKVLRVDKVFGAPVAGDIPGTRIYTFGHRNVQGLAFRPGTSEAYSVEHGPDRDDELNRLVGGGNYGWNPVPGYNESVPMTDLAEFPAAVSAVWSSGAPTLATSGATFLAGKQWGAYNGALAVACLKASQLRLMFLGRDRVVAQKVVLTGFGRVRTPVQGPDGSLYVTTSNGGGADRILRLRPVL